MTEAQRRAYLEAMGIDVWLERQAEPVWDRLVLGPGAGSTLLVCNDPEDAASALAADIVRAFGSQPVWCWPDRSEASDKPRLEEVVGQELMTTVMLFGNTLANRLFNGAIPRTLGSAKIVVAEDLQTLAVNGGARQGLWRILSQNIQSREDGACG
jgi:hypothetical protein